MLSCESARIGELRQSAEAVSKSNGSGVRFTSGTTPSPRSKTLPVEMKRSVEMAYAPTIQRSAPVGGEVKRSSWLNASTSRNWCCAWSAPKNCEQHRLVDRQEVELVAGQQLLERVVGGDRRERAARRVEIELQRGAVHVALVDAAIVDAHRQARVVHALGDVEVQRLRVDVARRTRAGRRVKLVARLPQQLHARRTGP